MIKTYLCILIHCAGISFCTGLLVLLAIGYAHYDWATNPGEITLVPRHAVDLQTLRPISAWPPNKPFLVQGQYQTTRAGCSARFQRTVEWISAYGPQQQELVHHGSFNVAIPQVGWSRYETTIPENAVAGSYFVSRISGAEWDCLHFPFGLSKIGVKYAELRILVEDQVPEQLNSSQLWHFEFGSAFARR